MAVHRNHHARGLKAWQPGCGSKALVKKGLVTQLSLGIYMSCFHHLGFSQKVKTLSRLLVFKLPMDPDVGRITLGRLKIFWNGRCPGTDWGQFRE